MNFAARLESLLKQRAITAYRLSKDIGVHQTTIKNWLSGKAPSSAHLKALSGYFGVSTDDLLDGGSSAMPTNTLEYALYGEAKMLDEDEKRQLLELARLMRKKRAERGLEDGPEPA